MTISSRKEALILFLGDLAVLLVSLWLTLFARYGVAPSEALWTVHFKPFLLLYVLWILVFFITGLYEKHTLILAKKLPQLIFNAQIVNVGLALLFFYLTPFFSIAPKTNLVIYVVVSSLLLYAWRKNALFFLNRRSRERALLIGRVDVCQELLSEVNGNNRYRFHFTSILDLTQSVSHNAHKEILNRIYEEKTKVVIIDMHDRIAEEALSHLYNLMFSGIQFVDLHRVYEEVFDRVPLGLLTYDWFIEHISLSPGLGYGSLKRFMDIGASIVMLLLMVPFFPIIALLIVLESRGPVFYWAERVGEQNRHVFIPKFRTMNVTDSSEDAVASKGQVTKVGKFLRKTRLDEFPQLWSVIKGDLSLIGPRPEIPHLARIYEEQIPYYGMRHLVRPGLSGWAQIYGEHAHHGVGVDETRNKLSYDLFYLKNRSLLLDVKIFLKTVKKVVTRSGL